MTVVPFRPRSVSEIVDASFQLLRRDYLMYVMIMAIAYAPYVVVLLLSGVSASMRSQNPSPSMMFFSVLGGFAWMAMVDAVVSVAVSDAYTGAGISVGGAFRRALGRTMSILALAMVKWAAVAIGFFLFIVPALYVVGRFFAIPAVVVLEQLGPFAALRRSSTLSKGLMGHVLKTLLLVWSVFMAFYLAVIMMTGFDAFRTGTMTTTAIIVADIVGALLIILVYPLLPVVRTVLYYDVRMRQEAYDIELMARAVDTAPAAGATTA